MVWFRDSVRAPGKGLRAGWRRDYGSGVTAFGRVAYDPPLPVGPAVRRMFKRCARRRQRAEDRLACRRARGGGCG